MISSENSLQETDPWQKLKGHCADEVLYAPKTWGDPLRPASMKMPQGLESTVTYLLNNVVGKPWTDTLVLLTAVQFSRNIQYKSIYTVDLNLNRGFADIFAALHLSSMAEWEVDKHLVLYLSGQIVETDSTNKRYLFWKQYLPASRHLKRWLSSLPKEMKIRYQPYIIPCSADPTELNMMSDMKQIRLDQQEKRKDETDALMPFYADLRTQAHLRYNLLKRLRKAYHKAIKAVEQGKAKLPFEFELYEGNNVMKNDPPSERLVFRLYDRRSFTIEHYKDYSPHSVYEARYKRSSYADEKNSYLLEFRKVESLNGEKPVLGLWFIELMTRRVLGDTNVPPEEHKAREAWLKEQGYGGDEDGVKHKKALPFRPKTPGILLPTKEGGDYDFISHASKLTGAILIPIESFYVAALFGMVALHIFTANGMRIGELLQLQANSECIMPIVIPAAPDSEDQTPSIHWAVRAIPKGHRTLATYYLDDEHLRLLSLIKLMLFEHYGLDPHKGGDLPIVPKRGIDKYRFPPDSYLFQYGNKILHGDDILVSMRFLMHGLVMQTIEGRRVTVLPHALRHGFATWALNVAKEPIDIVAAILNQKNLAVTKYYGRPNQRAIAEHSHGLMNQISSYIDVDDLILRSPEELRELLLKAKKTHGTLARVRGGRCLLNGECPIFFACIGCSAKVPDPAQRGEIEEFEQVTLIQIERATKRGLTLEAIQYQKKLKQCRAELQEMDMIELCREDENREPEVNFDVEA